MELAVPVDGEAAEAVCELFERHGGGAVVEVLLSGPEDGTDLPVPKTHVRTYIPLGDVDARAKLEAGLWHLGRIYPIPKATLRPLAEANWAERWKSHYTPQRIGKSFYVVPTWIEPDARESDRVIRMDPGMAFGTGLHPTTRLCLAALERHVAGGDAVLDIGTGSGILAIAGALLGASEVAAIDLSPDAVEIARANAERNGVHLLVQAGELHELEPAEYDVVVANLLASTIIELAPALIPRLRPGGIVISSGILVDQRDTVEEALTTVGLAKVEHMVSGDWVATAFRRDGSRANVG